MSKQLELTIDLEIRRVTCPGVWLCQDGSVSLILHALNSTYQTHLVPPVFPMIFKTAFQFRKKFPISCAVRNLGCVLKDEDLYCELVQWTSHCMTDEGIILAQYLGALTDILFVPEVCSSEGIDLLMRRTKDYPGILAPKIETATRVRLEEVSSSGLSIVSPPSKKCKCTTNPESHSHKPVCHTSQYHRLKCSPKKTCKSRSQSCGSSRSICDGMNDIINKNLSPKKSKICQLPIEKESINCRDFCNTSDVFSANINAGSWRRASEKNCCRVLDEDNSFRNESAVFNARNESVGSWCPPAQGARRLVDEERESLRRRKSPCRQFTVSDLEDYDTSTTEDRYYSRSLLESRYIDKEHTPYTRFSEYKKPKIYNVSPCTCYICRRYHEIFMPDYS